MDHPLRGDHGQLQSLSLALKKRMPLGAEKGGRWVDNEPTAEAACRQPPTE